MSTVAAGIAITIVAGCGVAVFRSEWEGLSPRLARWIMRKATAIAPADVRERLGEEWEAVLADMPSPLSKLFAALGFFVAGCALRSQPSTALKHRSMRVLKLLVTSPAMLSSPIAGTICAVVGGILTNYGLPPLRVSIGWLHVEIATPTAAMFAIAAFAFALSFKGMMKCAYEVRAALAEDL